MKKAKKIDKLDSSIERKNKVSQGFFDGRFVERKIENKKHKSINSPKYKQKDYE